jgi:hypothetical protein
MSLTREEILAQNIPPMEEASAWGGTVWLRGIPLSDALALLSEDDDEHRGVLLLEAAVVDEDGKPIFKKGDVANLQLSEDIDRLLAKAVEINPLFQRAGDDEEGN